MNLRDFIYVVAVAENKNFSRAAIECNVSQPALSSQIKKLENELGTDLFERRANEVVLTEFGKRIVASAEEIIKQVDAIKDIASEYRDLEALPFKIGMTTTLAPYITKYFRDMFAELYPNMRIVLLEHKPTDLAHMVEAKKVDIALIARKSHTLIYGSNSIAPLDFMSIWHEPVLLGVRKGHPLTRKPSIRAKDVPPELMIRFKISFGYDLEKDLPEATPEMIEKTGFDVTAARFETVCRHVGQSDDCTIVNAIAAEHFREYNWELDFIEFEDEGNLRDLGVVYRPGYPRHQIIDKMAEYINANPPKGAIPASDKIVSH